MRAGRDAARDRATAAETGREYRITFTFDSGKIPAETPFDLLVRRGTTITITCRYARPPARPEPIEPFFSLLWLPYGSANRIM